MLSLVPKDSKHDPMSEATRAEVSRFLHDAFQAGHGLLSDLDRWTQRRVTVENLAKIELAHAADDPVEHCYQNLIREIDTEARTGIFLVGKNNVAPILFADALAHSDDQLDIVWVTIQANFERARVDAEISRIALGILMKDVDVADDMAAALRSLMYAFHEHATRYQCNLPALLDERQARELMIMVAQLEIRAGNYEDRIREITSRADTQ